MQSTFRTTVELDLEGGECTVVVKQRPGNSAEDAGYCLEEVAVIPQEMNNCSNLVNSPGSETTAASVQGTISDQSPMSSREAWKLIEEKQDDSTKCNKETAVCKNCDDESNISVRCPDCRELIISGRLMQHTFLCDAQPQIKEVNIQQPQQEQPQQAASSEDCTEIKCPECGVGFHTDEDLTIHLEIHQMLAKNVMKMQESSCMKQLMAWAKEGLVRPDVHLGKSACCNVCQQQFPDPSWKSYHEHMHQEFPYHCRKCDLFFHTLQDLQRQRCVSKKHHKAFKYRCARCKGTMLDAHKMMKHRHKCKGKVEVCMLCKMSFRHFKDLEMHAEVCSARTKQDTQGETDSRDCSDVKTGEEIPWALKSDTSTESKKETTFGEYSSKSTLDRDPSKNVVHIDQEMVNVAPPSHSEQEDASYACHKCCRCKLSITPPECGQSFKRPVELCQECLTDMNPRTSEKGSPETKPCDIIRNGLLNKGTCTSQMPSAMFDDVQDVKSNHKSVKKKKQKISAARKICGANGESQSNHAGKCNAVRKTKRSSDSMPSDLLLPKVTNNEVKIELAHPQGKRTQKQCSPKCKSIYWKDNMFRKRLKLYRGDWSKTVPLRSRSTAQDDISSEDNLSLSSLKNGNTGKKVIGKCKDLPSCRVVDQLRADLCVSARSPSVTNGKKTVPEVMRDATHLQQDVDSTFYRTLLKADLGPVCSPVHWQKEPSIPVSDQSERHETAAQDKLTLCVSRGKDYTFCNERSRKHISLSGVGVHQQISVILNGVSKDYSQEGKEQHEEALVMQPSEQKHSQGPAENSKTVDNPLRFTSGKQGNNSDKLDIPVNKEIHVESSGVQSLLFSERYNKVSSTNFSPGISTTGNGSTMDTSLTLYSDSLTVANEYSAMQVYSKREIKLPSLSYGLSESVRKGGDSCASSLGECSDNAESKVVVARLNQCPHDKEGTGADFSPVCNMDGEKNDLLRSSVNDKDWESSASKGEILTSTCKHNIGPDANPFNIKSVAIDRECDTHDPCFVDENVVVGHYCVYCTCKFSSRKTLWEHAKGCRDNHLKVITNAVTTEEERQFITYEEQDCVPFTVLNDIPSNSVKKMCQDMGLNLSKVGKDGIKADAYLTATKKKKKKDKKRRRRYRCSRFGLTEVRKTKLAASRHFSVSYCESCNYKFKYKSHFDTHNCIKL